MKFLTITSSSRSFHFSLMHNQLTSSSAGVAESKEEFGRKENIVSTTGFKIFTTTTVKNNGSRFLLPVPVFAEGSGGKTIPSSFLLVKGGFTQELTNEQICLFLYVLKNITVQ